MRHIVCLQLHCIILRLIGRNNHTNGMTMSRAWNPDYVFESQRGASASVSVSGWWRVWTWSIQMVQWNLYKTATRFYGLSRQVVFHDRENKHDFVWTVPDKLQNLCVLVRLPRFHYTCSTVPLKTPKYTTPGSIVRILFYVQQVPILTIQGLAMKPNTRDITT